MAHGDLSELGDALREARKTKRMTQEEMAQHLGVSRKTYVLFESCRWLPPPQRRGHFVRKLHALYAPAAHRLVEATGETLDDYVFGVPAAPAHAPALDAKQAKLAFDAAVYSTAEEAELAPKVLRAVANMLLARLADAGVTLAQATALAKSAAAEKKK